MIFFTTPTSMFHCWQTIDILSVDFRMKSFFDGCPGESDLKIKIKNLVLFKKSRITRATVRTTL